MSETLNEQLSALLDGELPPEETELLLKRLHRDPGLRATLGRYNAAGDVLRGDRAQASPRFTLRVSQAIAREAPHVGPAALATAREAASAAPTASVASARNRLPRWVQSVGGLAVAATVAAVAVVILQRDPGVAPGAAAPVAQQTVPAAAPGAAPAPVAQLAAVPARRGTGEPLSYVTPPPPTGTIGLIPDAQLANYVVAHSEFSSPLGRRNVLTGLAVEQAPPAADR